MTVLDVVKRLSFVESVEVNEVNTDCNPNVIITVSKSKLKDGDFNLIDGLMKTQNDYHWAIKMIDL